MVTVPFSFNVTLMKNEKGKVCALHAITEEKLQYNISITQFLAK